MKLSIFFQRNYLGIILAVLLGVAAMTTSEMYSGPVMLFAILIGLALHPVYESKKLQPGINWCARPLLLTGVALLGFRVNIHDFAALGIVTPIIVLSALALTIIVGSIIAKIIGVRIRFGVLISGAIAICGVSAAVAISSALPKSDARERDLALAVAGITVMSTLAMITYPILSMWLGHTTLQSAVFLGASIHDVAQVVGAGYTISDEVGNSATLVKLVRVSALLPVVLIIGYVFRDKNNPTQGHYSNLLPSFLIVYLVIAGLNSYDSFPIKIQNFGIAASKFCLITSLVAIGLKTNLHSMTSVGKAPLLLLVGMTLFLALTSLMLVTVLM